MTEKQAVFIAGSGHSGSTLLDMCLGGHPDIAALGETGFLYFYAHKTTRQDICTCGKTIENCEFWSKVVERLAKVRGLKKENVLDDFVLSDPEQMLFNEKGDYRDRLPQDKPVNASLLRPFVGVLGSGTFFRTLSKFSALLDKRRRAAENRMLLLDAVLAAQGKNIALDSTKSPGTLKEAWMLRGKTPVKFIVMHRNGRGVAASHIRRLNLTMPQAAALWRNEIIKWWVASLTIPRKNKITVKYESFAANPEGELRRICAFLGIAYDENMLSFREGRHNLGGNQMRFRQGETEIKLDERWRHELSQEQLVQFNKTAGWVNKLLGYQ